MSMISSESVVQHFSPIGAKWVGSPVYEGWQSLINTGHRAKPKKDLTCQLGTEEKNENICKVMLLAMKFTVDYVKKQQQQKYNF